MQRLGKFILTYAIVLLFLVLIIPAFFVRALLIAGLMAWEKATEVVNKATDDWAEGKL